MSPVNLSSYPNVPTKSEQNTNKENVIKQILIILIQSLGEENTSQTPVNPSFLAG